MVREVAEARLVVPANTRPRVSVIIVLYGRADMAIPAIAALIANSPPCFELIIVDNASPDDALELVSSRVVGATIVRNSLNVGFSAGVDVGALHARGEFLLLLNSDVFVEPGWLPPLLAALDRSPSLAGVSPVLLNIDGSVQEAGSLLFAGGVTRAVTSADRWALDFSRTVPYVSAACLLLRRSVFTKLGGLDCVYGLGYYEDVELAMELDHLGLSLGYVAGSSARHVHGASSSRERAMRRTVHNRAIFARRWQSRLDELPPATDHLTASAEVRARDAFAVDRVLIIDDRVPQTDRGSGDPRMATIATRLAALWPAARVTLLGASLDGADRYAPALLAAGVEVAACSFDGAQRWLEQRAGHYSAIIISRTDNLLRFREMVERTQPLALIVADVEAIYSRRTAMRATVMATSDPALAASCAEEAVRQREVELEGWNWAQVAVCVSREEAAEVRAVAPGTTVHVLPPVARAPERLVPYAERSGVVFFGGFMGGEASPNADSVRHLVDDIMPLLWSRRPQLALTVAGSDPTPSILSRAGERVAVIGRVDDPFHTLGARLVHVVPERFGAGVKTKLIESMASGTPFVTSPIGAQGLHLGELARHLVADHPAQFAEMTLALLDDPDLWRFVQRGLAGLAEQHFSPLVLDRTLVELMADLGAAPPLGP